MGTGQLTIVTDADPGVVINLPTIRLDTNPLSNSLCIEVITTKGYSYIIQYHSESERERWATQMETMVKGTKASAQGSASHHSATK
jgi:hypothetical protein